MVKATVSLKTMFIVLVSISIVAVVGYNVVGDYPYIVTSSFSCPLAFLSLCSSSAGMAAAIGTIVHYKLLKWHDRIPIW